MLAEIGKTYFGDIVPALGTVLGIPHLTFDARITGLLSFVYTYHYLNWFIKADVIRWAAVPKPPLAAIAVLSLAATGLYLYNYVYGFLLLFLLSLTCAAGISPQQHQHPPARRGHRRKLAAPRENALPAVGFLPSVIPAKAGIQRPPVSFIAVDSGICRNDKRGSKTTIAAQIY
jgi:hypothetical protein